MYDILQLNDMIVPELLDIAEQLKIPNTKKMDKQELVYKILDNQAIAGSKVSGDGKSKQRKRIIKTTTGNTTEEAIVESDKKPAKKLQVKKAHKDPIEEKSNIKKGRKKEELVDSEGEELAAPDEDSETPVSNTPAEVIAPEDETAEETTSSQASRIYPQRRDQIFNIEFDGVIMSEGVLEMTRRQPAEGNPDGARLPHGLAGRAIEDQIERVLPVAQLDRHPEGA